MNGGVGDHDVDLAVLLFNLIGDPAKGRNVADVSFHRRSAPTVVLDPA